MYLRRVQLLTVFVLVLSLTGFSHAQDKTKDDAIPKELLGYWQCTTDSKRCVAIEKDRYIEAHADGRLTVRPIERVASGRIHFPNLGQGGAAGLNMYNFDGDLLKLGVSGITFDGKRIAPVTYRKVVKMPAILKPTPAPMARIRPLAYNLTRSIKQSLIERMQRDQKSRKTGYSLAALRAQTEDEAWLKKTIKDYGWIDVKRFGREATLSAFLIAQHSDDMRLRLAAENGLAADLKKRQPVGGMYPWLVDRSGLYLHGRQRYGTHFRPSRTGAIEILPLEDEDKVNQWRTELRLPSWSTYLKQMEKQSGGRKVVVLKSVRAVPE